MALSRVSIGLAVRSVREAAVMTLDDLATAVGMTSSSLSRTENGLRAVEFAEVVRLSEVVGLPVEAFLGLAQAFENQGATAKSEKRGKLKADLDRLQREAVEAAVEARSQGG
jgi:transcriptional regulator with XRE-family HTH domain